MCHHLIYKVKQLGYYKQINQAIEEKRCIQLVHHSIDKGRTNRVIEPLVLLFKAADWYIYAFCRERQSLRCFKLVRIQELKVLDEHFEERDVEIGGFYDFFEETEDKEIILKTDKEFAKFIQEFHYVVNVKKQGNDVIITLLYTLNNWLYNVLLGFGNRVTVISPENVRNRVIEIIKEMNDLYDK